MMTHFSGGRGIQSLDDLLFLLGPVAKKTIHSHAYTPMHRHDIMRYVYARICSVGSISV